MASNDSTTAITSDPSNYTLRFNKFLQGIKDDNKAKRKTVMVNLEKDIRGLTDTKSIDDNLLKFLLKSILPVLTDTMEKCREVTVDILQLLHRNCQMNDDLVSIIIINFKHRLGQKEIIETSEELRLKFYDLLYEIIEKSSKNLLNIHLDEFIPMMINSFVDNYAEVKKKGCSCSRLLAKKLHHDFHKQSESLIKPLLSNITHQHSRVRKDIVECIGDVILYGNNKSVDDVLIHLSQRLFDQAYQVRLSVVQVVGGWLLDMLDRYSFWHKLIPLLLTGFIDEIDEVRSTAEALWWDVGIKYEKENETELKDKIDFAKGVSSYYPEKIERPNIGCRELVKSNLSRIVPAILNDISDWVESTRVKSIQLLYVFIWQAEENITQHLELVLQTLFKAANDSESLVRSKCVECASLLGYFTQPDITFKLLLQAIRKQTSNASICVLNGVIKGYRADVLYSYLDPSMDVLVESCSTFELPLQREIVNCSESLLNKYKNIDQLEWSELIGYRLFKLLTTTLALTSSEDLKGKISILNQQLIEATRQTDKNALYTNFMPKFINELKQTSNVWNESSYDRLIFQTLVIESDLIVNDYLSEVIPILSENLQLTKDIETRTKFLILLSQIILKCDTLEKNNFCQYAQTACNDLIIPNILWKAGRTATAIRMTATAALLTLFQANFFQNIQFDKATVDAIHKQMIATLDDENKQTRVYTCRILQILYATHTTQLGNEQLNQIYTELLKRLDDSSDEIRNLILDIFDVYLKLLATKSYDKILYQAHLEVIYSGLLIHLDDANQLIQEKSLRALKTGSVLHDEKLIEEIEKVKNKHRTPYYCDQLLQHIQDRRLAQ